MNDKSPYNEIVEAVKLDTTYIACVVQCMNRNIWNMILSVLQENGILVDIFDEDGTPKYELSYVYGFMFTTYQYLDEFGRQAEQHTQIQFYNGSLPNDNVKRESGQVWIDGVRHLIIDMANELAEDLSAKHVG